MILGWGSKKTPFFVKNRDFSHILLCAKFNRFFIILGGGSKMTKKPRFWWFWRSHILGLGSKNREKPWYLISVFWRFLTFGYTGDRTRYTGKTGIFTENGVKIGHFSHISLCAKFNRFFIILGGGRIYVCGAWIHGNSMMPGTVRCYLQWI